MEDKPKRIKKPRGKASLIPGACIACGARCESSCSTGCISMDESGAPVIDTDVCIGCGKCVKICPSSALEMVFTPEEQAILDEIARQKAAAQAGGAQAEVEDEEEAAEARKLAAYLAQYRGVWVFVEQNEGVAAKVSWELLGVGAELAKSLDVELCSVVLGHDVEHLCAEAFSYGAEKVYLVDDPVLEHYRTKPYSECLRSLVEEYKPEVVLIGATGTGRDLAGAAATLMHTGLTADCTGLAIIENRMLAMTRPAFGGNIMATILCEKNRPQMSSVRAHVMPLPEQVEGRTSQVVRADIGMTEDEIPTKVLEVIMDAQSEGIPVDESEILISAGMGLGVKENLAYLWELAEELGGTVSGSRRTIDAGWLPPERQVGQTGKTVRPKIYIACGISGAIQHKVGMQDSDLIIAINTDEDAPIFEIADYGILGDAKTIVCEMTRRVREIKAATSEPSQEG